MYGNMVKPSQLRNLLDRRARVYRDLDETPYSLTLYIEACAIYQALGYPDLAAGAAYKALLLADAVQDESDEYHEQAKAALPNAFNISDLSRVVYDIVNTTPELLTALDGHGAQGQQPDLASSGSSGDPQTPPATEIVVPFIHGLLAESLLECGCLHSAYKQCQLGLMKDGEHERLFAIRSQILDRVRRHRSTGPEVSVASLEAVQDSWPDSGFGRREWYPWNDIEPDRFCQESLDFLNAEVARYAPKLEVRAVELPFLGSINGISKQLGVFAKADIEPGELVLEETSLLTANNRLQDAICDACGREITHLSCDVSESTTCDECFAVFCSQQCFDLANESYHPAVCDKDVDSIARDVAPTQAADSLYLLLLLRSLAMAETQDVHPLELKEIKYIWGDYDPSPTYLNNDTTRRSLPFRFESNIVLPFHMLTKMDIDIFAQHRRYDTWIFNTLYAKFRGTASARLSGPVAPPSRAPPAPSSDLSPTPELDLTKEVARIKLTRGPRGPEVSAVHPSWCLANHSCDPNVSWEWGGTIRFHARRDRVAWERRRSDGTLEQRQPVATGIKRGDEVLSHYCDVGLDVVQRREWAAGALGGACRCARCVWEAGDG